MPNTQQKVLIYKENIFATAQRQFEKDLTKQQREGFQSANCGTWTKV